MDRRGEEGDVVDEDEATTAEGRKARLGHRVVKDGVVYYKKVSTDELKQSIQFGIYNFLKKLDLVDVDRDLLMQDFQVIETIHFPKEGSQTTPSHEFTDFKIKVYAPYGFRYLRRKFNINEADFMNALGGTELKDVSNPGASGSVFYKTSNDKYILKTVQHQESEVLKALLAGYTLNLLQNLINQKFSLLPTIYGLFYYQRQNLTSMVNDKTNIRIMIMNNILPSDIPIHEKYDLKGSLYKRKASPKELAKSHPTYKDKDFLERHPNGIQIDERHYDNIISSIKRDCMVLESFGIMDYSLLIGIHNLEKRRNPAIDAFYEAKLTDRSNQNTNESSTNLTTRYSNFNFARMTSNFKKYDNVFNISAVPSVNSRGERLLLYIGIIDILQNYRLKKRIEHALKSMIADSREISVCHPKLYSARFINFMTNQVFRKARLTIRKSSSFIQENTNIVNEITAPEKNLKEPSQSSQEQSPIEISRYLEKPDEAVDLSQLGKRSPPPLLRSRPKEEKNISSLTIQHKMATTSTQTSLESDDENDQHKTNRTSESDLNAIVSNSSSSDSLEEMTRFSNSKNKSLHDITQPKELKIRPYSSPKTESLTDLSGQNEKSIVVEVKTPVKSTTTRSSIQLNRPSIRRELDIKNYLDINRTEFTVKRRPQSKLLSLQSVSTAATAKTGDENETEQNSERTTATSASMSIYDNHNNNDDELADLVRKMTAQREHRPVVVAVHHLTSRPTTTTTTNSRQQPPIQLKTPPAVVLKQHFSNLTTTRETNVNQQVTSFTVDRSHMRRNFMRGGASF